MSTFQPEEHPHRRQNLLTGEWVLVSPHRTKRPWQGQMEKTAALDLPTYDPECYLCPGNERAGGFQNPSYDSTFVFTNDYAALLPDVPPGRWDVGGMLHAESENGVCRVICFSPRHDLTLARLPVPQLQRVVDVWVEQFTELDAREDLGYVLIFENRGAMMGASNPHPHGQLWATRHIPHEVIKEDVQQREYFERTGRSLLSDYLDVELKAGDRLVCSNDEFVALVPFWAIWPFEVMVVSRRHFGAWQDLNTAERAGLADILKRVATRYDNLFETSFPYSFGVHARPRGEHPHWHFHAHFMPPLLRSATVRKFMVGYELLGTPQRDITPEQAAQRLRQLSEVHYGDPR